MHVLDGVREAEAVREGFGEPFPALPCCLLESSKLVHGTLVGTSRLGERKPSFFSSKLSGVDGTRTPGDTGAPKAENLPGSSMLPEGPKSETTRDEPVSRPFARMSRPFANPNPKLTVAELERAIVDAVRMGVGRVAETLAVSLDALRQGLKVIDLESRRPK